MVAAVNVPFSAEKILFVAFSLEAKSDVQTSEIISRERRSIGEWS